MHFTSPDDYYYPSDDHLKMQQQKQQQEIKPSQSPSLQSSHHTVTNLINSDQTAAYFNPALLEAMSNLNGTQSYQFFDLANKFFQQQQQKDDKLKKQDLAYDSLPISSSISVTSNSSSSSSSSNISSPNSTPCKKKALSEVITKLRNQQSTTNDDDSMKITDDNNENDSAHNNSTNNDYSDDYAHDNNEEDDDEDDLEDEFKKSKTSKSTNKTNCSSSSSSSTSSSGIDMISNASSNSNLMIANGDYNLISAAEQISAIINNVVVNTHNLTSSPAPSSPLQQQSRPLNQHENNLAKANINRINNLIMNSNKKSQTDLMKLLERANLTQYMSAFIEQGGDDIDQLVEADEQEFKEIIELVGMTSKPLHVKRLRKAIDEYKNSNKDCATDFKVPVNSTQSNTNSTAAINSTPKSQINEVTSMGTLPNSGQQLSSHTISKFLSDSSSSTSTFNNAYSSSSSSSSSSTSSTSSTSSQSSSNPFSISKLCSQDQPTTYQNTPNPNSVAALYPLYQFLNPKNITNFIQHQQQILTSGFVAPTLPAPSNSSHDINGNQKLEQKKDDDLNEEEEDEEELEDEMDEENDENDETDEENFEDEDNEDYDEEMNQEDKQETKHSSFKKKDLKAQQQQQAQQAQATTSIKIEQNEKMIKKNKVIELYSKGERCVRKLSQLTGVPLTTVYRVIGKLKGINYNIPRGNGAGRKTILDAQDREILVEILNVQPRISRKALGKELEKRTGKSIHNSTLNRELCRLRHHGHNFAAVHAVAGNSFNDQMNLIENQNQNYLKHFNNSRKTASNPSPLNVMPLPLTNNVMNNTANKQPLTKPNIKTAEKTVPINKPKQIKTEHVLEAEYAKKILNETKNLCSTLSKSDSEMKPVSNLNPNLYNQINELCSQTIDQEIRLSKVKLLVTSLLKEDKQENNLFLHEACTQLCLIKPTLLTRKNDLISYARRILDNCLIYDDCNRTKSETQLSKRIKLEKVDDESKQQQIIQQQQQYSHQQIANNFSQLYTAALALHLQNQSGGGTNLRTNQMQDLLSKLPLNNLLQSQLTNGVSSLMNPESLDLKQKQISLIENIDLQLKMNQKYQDDLKAKLAVFAASDNEDMRCLIEPVRKQLNDLVKKQSDLSIEQIRLRTDLDNSCFNFAQNNDYDDEQLDDVNSTVSSSSSRSIRFDNKDTENDKRLITGNFMKKVFTNDKMEEKEEEDESVEINDETLNQNQN